MHHSCSAPIVVDCGMRFAVKDAQIPIAAWMREMMDRYDLTPSRWAVKAKVARNTVSRAINEGYEHVTSTSTLVKLASVLDEPLPASAAVAPFSSDRISLESLEQVVAGIVEIVAPTTSAEVQRVLVLALRDTLSVLSVEPEAAADPMQARLVARSLAHRQRP